MVVMKKVIMIMIFNDHSSSNYNSDNNDDINDDNDNRHYNICACMVTVLKISCR